MNVPNIVLYGSPECADSVKFKDYLESMLYVPYTYVDVSKDTAGCSYALAANLKEGKQAAITPVISVDNKDFVDHMEAIIHLETIFNN